MAGMCNFTKPTALTMPAMQDALSGLTHITMLQGNKAALGISTTAPAMAASASKVAPGMNPSVM